MVPTGSWPFYKRYPSKPRKLANNDELAILTLRFSEHMVTQDNKQYFLFSFFTTLCAKLAITSKYTQNTICVIFFCCSFFSSFFTHKSTHVAPIPTLYYDWLLYYVKRRHTSVVYNTAIPAKNFCYIWMRTEQHQISYATCSWTLPFVSELDSCDLSAFTRDAFAFICCPSALWQKLQLELSQ